MTLLRRIFPFCLALLLLCAAGCDGRTAESAPDRSDAASEAESGGQTETAAQRELRLGGNQQVGGRFLDADGYIYTSFHVRDPKTDIFTDALTRRRSDGSDKQTLFDRDDLTRMNMADGKLYGISGRELFCMDPDGGNRTVLLGAAYEGCFLFGLSITEDAVFVLESDDDTQRLVRYTRELKERKVLLEDCRGFQRVGDRLYYYDGLIGDDEGTIGSIRTDGTDRQTLAEVKAYQILVTENYVFYLTNGTFSDGIWRMDRDGKNPKKLINGTCGELNAFGGWLYAVTSDGQNLFRVREDGSGTEALPPQNVSNVHFLDGKMYYVQWGEQSVWRADTDGENAERIDP